MSFIKKQSAGFYLCLLTLVAAVASFACYLVNCGTSYFSALGTNAGVIGCSVAAIVLELVILVGSQKTDAPTWWSVAVDVCYVAVAVLLLCAFGYFLSDRVNSIASIATFNQNAQNMADLMSALVGIVLYFVAALIGIVSSFCRVRKDE